ARRPSTTLLFPGHPPLCRPRPLVTPCRRASRRICSRFVVTRSTTRCCPFDPSVYRLLHRVGSGRITLPLTRGTRETTIAPSARRARRCPQVQRPVRPTWSTSCVAESSDHEDRSRHLAATAVPRVSNVPAEPLLERWVLRHDVTLMPR